MLHRDLRESDNPNTVIFKKCLLYFAIFVAITTYFIFIYEYVFVAVVCKYIVSFLF